MDRQCQNAGMFTGTIVMDRLRTLAGCDERFCAWLVNGRVCSAAQGRLVETTSMQHALRRLDVFWFTAVRRRDERDLFGGKAETVSGTAGDDSCRDERFCARAQVDETIDVAA